MQLPSMKYAERLSKSTQVKFRGLNHVLGARDGDLWDMENMTSDHYPVLSTRAKRRKFKTLRSPGGLFAMQGLCWVDGTGFYHNGEIRGNVTEGQKHFAAMGDYILIFPDKCWYNTATDSFGSLEAVWSGSSLTFCNGLLYGVDAEANTIFCEGVNWSEWFREGDAVTISGCTTNAANNITEIIRGIDGDKLYFYENVFLLGSGGEYTETGSLSIARRVPDLEQVCENESRLWGRCGNTIYASKPRDIFNWNVYDGLESDAWAVDCASAGRLSGCISFRGFPTFFKEDNIYKVYGSVPSEFEVMGSASLGIPEGSGNSLAIAGETLFFLSRNGVMAYTGGIPQLVSECFGTDRFRDGVAGSDGLKYYISMRNDAGEWWLYVFDTQKGMWHKEDRMRITHFAKHDGNLYALNDQGEIWMLGNIQDAPEDAVSEEEVPFMVEFSDFTEEDPNKKGVGKLQIRIELEEDASAQCWIQFDSSGNWLPIGQQMLGSVKQSHILPIAPTRCDHYRIRITGTGECRIFSLARESYSGSEYKSRKGTY